MRPETIHVYEIDQYVNERNVLFVDVRNESSFRRGHLKNAINIPVGRFVQELRQLPAQRQLILYCERGSSSMYAARLLARQGIHAMTVLEGIEGYRGKYWTN